LAVNGHRVCCPNYRRNRGTALASPHKQTIIAGLGMCFNVTKVLEEG